MNLQPYSHKKIKPKLKACLWEHELFRWLLLIAHILNYCRAISELNVGARMKMSFPLSGSWKLNKSLEQCKKTGCAVNCGVKYFQNLPKEWTYSRVKKVIQCNVCWSCQIIFFTLFTGHCTWGRAKSVVCQGICCHYGN